MDGRKMRSILQTGKTRLDLAYDNNKVILLIHIGCSTNNPHY